uniref:ATP synthase complex subunit 8 n=1 Tax=Apolemichthys arcuatus TaxID=1474870 RepID=A0A1S5PM26_9TELE|nr:ATP synthase F0 subunit 8 [Apolemichthys arcuatus]
MPQLNPNPWFAILMFTWLVFLYYIPLKIAGHAFPCEPIVYHPEFEQPETWVWPWP